MLHGMSVRARQWPSSWPYSSRPTGLQGWLNFASSSSSHMSRSQMLVMTYVVEVVGVGIAENLDRCSHGCGCERRVDFVILAQFLDRQSRNRKTYVQAVPLRDMPRESTSMGPSAGSCGGRCWHLVGRARGTSLVRTWWCRFRVYGRTSRVGGNRKKLVGIDIDGKCNCQTSGYHG
jgi:hypothetical protein